MTYRCKFIFQILEIHVLHLLRVHFHWQDEVQNTGSEFQDDFQTSDIVLWQFIIHHISRYYPEKYAQSCVWTLLDINVKMKGNSMKANPQWTKLTLSWVTGLATFTAGHAIVETWRLVAAYFTQNVLVISRSVFFYNVQR